MHPFFNLSSTTFKMYGKVVLILVVFGSLESQARYRNLYLSSLLPGDCLDCGFSRQVCGVKKPCKINECEIGCIKALSYLEYENGREIERQGTCDSETKVDTFSCLNDMQCEKTKICCHSETGSYCN